MQSRELTDSDLSIIYKEVLKMQFICMVLCDEPEGGSAEVLHEVAGWSMGSQASEPLG